MVKYRYTKGAFAGETHWGKQTAHAGFVGTQWPTFSFLYSDSFNSIHRIGNYSGLLTI